VANAPDKLRQRKDVEKPSLSGLTNPLLSLILKRRLRCRSSPLRPPLIAQNVGWRRKKCSKTKKSHSVSLRTTLPCKKMLHAMGVQHFYLRDQLHHAHDFRASAYHCKMMIHSLVLLLHLLAAIFWVGGMALMLFCVRPAALATLQAPQPIALLHAVLHRFLQYVGIAIAALLLTGIHLYGLRGGMAARWGVHVMALGGLAMMLIYGHIRYAGLKQLTTAVSAQDWPAAKTALESVRQKVMLNLALGVVIIAAVKMGA
jgi:uncharacterized membrane protein